MAQPVICQNCDEELIYTMVEHLWVHKPWYSLKCLLGQGSAVPLFRK